MSVHYQLSLASPHRHEFAVTLTFSNNPESGAVLSLPAWIPGSYMIRDFARQVSDVAAYDARKQTLAIHKTDKQTWQLAASEGQVQVSYRVYAWDMSVRSAYFDQTRAYFNGTSVFMRVAGQTDRVHHLELLNPAFTAAQNWQVSSSMHAVDIDAKGFGTYQAENYAALIDYPFEIGCHQQTEFILQDKPHRMIFTDAGSIDLARIQADVGPICAEHAAMFGELPVDRYLFMTLATADGYGGLEHRDSTSLICQRAALPYAGLGQPDKAYRQFLALCSHEYFHLWHVKRIQPAKLQTDVLAREAHTELLWAFEGITSYYDELALPRAQRITPESYLDMLAESVTRLMRTPGRKHQSVAESSFDAWTKFYKQDENAPNAIVSYYVKGTFIAFGLDHLLRTQSGDVLCLDDLMRRLWQKYGRTGMGIPERQIENAVADMLQQPVEAFFADYVYGTKELPLAAWFADFAIGYQLRPAQSAQDMGGYPASPRVTQSAGISLGAKISEKGELVCVDRVMHGSAAEAAGLAAGDILLAIDGERCTSSRLTAMLQRKTSGDSMQVTYFRRDLLMHSVIQAQPAQADTCELWLLDETQASVEALSRRAAWLRSSQHG